MPPKPQIKKAEQKLREPRVKKAKKEDPLFVKVASIASKSSVIDSHLYATETYRDAPVINAAMQAVQFTGHGFFQSFDTRCQSVLKAIKNTIAVEVKSGQFEIEERQLHELEHAKLHDELTLEASKFDKLLAILRVEPVYSGDYGNTAIGDRVDRPDQGLMVDGAGETDDDSEMRSAGAVESAGKTGGFEDMVKNGFATNTVDSLSIAFKPVAAKKRVERTSWWSEAPAISTPRMSKRNIEKKEAAKVINKSGKGNGKGGLEKGSKSAGAKTFKPPFVHMASTGSASSRIAGARIDPEWFANSFKKNPKPTCSQDIWRTRFGPNAEKEKS